MGGVLKTEDHNVLNDFANSAKFKEHNNTTVNSTSTINTNITNSIYLVETFYISSKKNTVFQVCLTGKGLTLKKENANSHKEQTIGLHNIIGCRCLRSRKRTNGSSSCACSAMPGAPNQLKVVEENSVELDESDVSAYLYIYAYILKKSRRSERRERTTITLRFRSFDKYEDNNREAQKWRTAIKCLINGEHPKASVFVPKDPRKLLIILNPKSGSGKAREVFQQRVAPILAEAEIAYDLHVTKRANYGREFVRTKHIFQWRAIVVVGGDGIYYEIINGLFERPDWEKVMLELPMGIIPCGSGNGLARSIAHCYNEPYDPKPVLSASLNVIRGQTGLMDLVRVETRSQISFSFLSVGWGLISDIDIESERLRAIGYPRFTLWSVHRLISLRTYSGTVSYMLAKNVSYSKGDKNILPKLKHSTSVNTMLDCPECHGEGDCETCDTDFGDVLSLETSNEHYGSFRQRLDSWYSINSRKSTYFSTTESIYQSVAEKLSDCTDEKKIAQFYGPAATIPALTAPIPETWTTETGDFIMVHAAYQTHLGSDCYFAPSSKLNDGIIWLLIIRGGCPRTQLLSFLLGLSSGTHVPLGNDHIKMIPVTAFRIEPCKMQGHITVDGERLDCGPVQGEIFPGIAKTMVPLQNKQK